MEKEIQNVTKKLEKYGIHNIDLLALVTETSYEVIFFGYVNGDEYKQSNKLAEEGIIPFDELDAFYAKIAEIIRTSTKYSKKELNILKIDEGDISFLKKNRMSDTFKIVRRWEISLGVRNI